MATSAGSDKLNDLANIILNVKTPHVIKYKKELEKNWKCFGESFEQWATVFDKNAGNTPKFDTGSIKFAGTPQWERFRKISEMTMTSFLQDAKNQNFESDNKWCSYSYKSIEELPPISAEGVDFNILGFPDLKEKISFWIGSKHAHTPCHYDTYGCNVVVQVFGRKSWLLFPPDTSLTDIRVPYEESSVYCKENFYSPSNYSQFKDIESKAYHVILAPGDVLIVPHKWWHYVENLEPSLNFNSWIELNQDLDSQIEECITKILIKESIDYLPKNVAEVLLNPNEVENIQEPKGAPLNDILHYLTNMKITNKRHKRMQKYNFLSECEIEKLLGKYADILHPVRKLNEIEFFEMMKVNSARYDANIEKEERDVDIRMKQHVIDVLCKNKLIQLIKDECLS